MVKLFYDANATKKLVDMTSLVCSEIKRVKSYNNNLLIISVSGLHLSKASFAPFDKLGTDIVVVNLACSASYEYYCLMFV